MLATLTDERFDDPDWIYERKLDGVRILAFRRGDAVRLLTRNRQARGDTYPEIAGALASQPADDFIVDGEVVAFEGDVTSFERLQGRMRIDEPKRALESGIPVFYYLFDVLHLEGRDLTKLPLRDRKRLLRAAFDFADPLRLLPYRNEDGIAFLKEACEKKWEGIIAKRADGEYIHARSRDWLKFKCVNRQEFVIGGWTEPHGSRTGLGALLIGYHEREAIRYAGKVGTGFDVDTLRALADRLALIERETAPFESDGLPRKEVHWVSPELVIEVEFTEWTRGGRLRHPRFVGLREDKDAADVSRERPRPPRERKREDA
jgi:bifunctional non-homologous end joining protein LigD